MDEDHRTARRVFLDRRRAISRERYDQLHAATYDQHWGDASPAHLAFVDRFIAATPPGGLVLDAACGTGKYWPQLLAAGRCVLGVDHSAGMLARAIAKHPGVAVRVLALQELGGQADLIGCCDGLICVDAMENVGPEDWPAVLDGFRAVLRAGAPLYLTVELPEAAPTSDDPIAVPGELVAEGYHFYPRRDRVLDWLAAAAFELREQGIVDEYWHLLLRRSPGG